MENNIETKWEIAKGGVYPIFIEFKLKHSIKIEEDVKDKVVNRIKGSISLRRNIWSSSARIPYSNCVFENNELIAFVLLKEEGLVGGMYFTEAVYAAKILHNTVRVLCLDFGQGSSFPKEEGSSHYRFLTGKLSKGVLTYTKKERYSYGWGKGISDNKIEVDLLQKFTAKS